MTRMRAGSMGDMIESGHDDAGTDESLPNGMGQAIRTWCIAVQAKGVGLDGKKRAVEARDVPIANETERAGDHGRFIMDHSTGLAARHQRAVGTVRAIGERFFSYAETVGDSCGDQLRSGEADQDESVIDCSDGSSDSVCLRAIHRCHVVKRAVRFHVSEPRAFIGTDARQRAYLTGDETFHFVWCDRAFAPAKSCPIG